MPLSTASWLASTLSSCGLDIDRGDWTQSHTGGLISTFIHHPTWRAFFEQEKESKWRCYAHMSTYLDKARTRLMINGMTRASGAVEQLILTSDLTCRDQLLQACLHAGYATTVEQVDGAADEESCQWRIAYSEPPSLCEDGSALPCIAVADIKEVSDYRGRFWCVTVAHDDHLIVVQRGEKDKSGSPSRCSLPVVIGQCFQKDPNRRIDAAGLLKHPWLRKSVEMQEVEELKRKAMLEHAAGYHTKSTLPRTTPESESEWDDDETIDEKKLRAARAKSAAAASPKTPLKKPSKPTAGDSDNEDWGAALDEEDADVDELPAQPVKGRKGRTTSTGAFPLEKNKKKSAPSDDDEEELVIKLRAPVADEDAFADFSDDEEEAAFPDDEDEETVVDKTSMKTIRPTPQITPAALIQKKEPPPSAAANTPSQSSGNTLTPGQVPSTSSTSSFPLLNGVASGGAASSAGGHRLESFVENDEDELDEYTELEADFEIKAINPPTHQPQHSQHHTKQNNFTAASAGDDANDDLDDVDDEVDPFDDITFEENDTAAEDVLLNRAFMRVIDALSPQNEERVVLDACEKLNEMGQKNPDQIRSMMTNHGVIPIMEMLEVTNPRILHAVLKVVNQIVGRNLKFQQNMSLVGLIPAIIRFGGSGYPPEIRMESASFVRQFCYATDWTRKMFIACDGLPVLVSFLLEDYHSSKTLVWNAIDCCRHVFDITTSPKNDFCRLFCKFGLLEPLSKTLLAIQSDTVSENAPEYVLKIAQILHLFSEGDKVVKLHFARPAVIESMLKALPSLPQDILILLLKSIRNISMDSTTLDLLESAGAIPALIPFLDSKQVSENQHQVLLTMYYLCQIKSSRQEQAALSGIIPHLHRFIRQDHPLKQFAYPIIFLLAKTSWKSRLELKKHGGLQFYIDILVSQDVYWRSSALETISFWVSASGEDAARVSFVLNTSSNINKLLRVFRETTDETQFDKMGNSMKKLLSASTTVNQSMGRMKEFIKEIKARYQHTQNMQTRRKKDVAYHPNRLTDAHVFLSVSFSFLPTPRQVGSSLFEQHSFDLTSYSLFDGFYSR